jgi:EAL domain-containing protein (putative c-di-GMP-specific phosphodiesterase class I)
VEDEFQHARLTHMGCDVGQGYLFGRPVPADEFLRTHLLAAHAPATPAEA